MGERLDWGEQGSARDPAVRQKPPCGPTEANTVDVSAAWPCVRRLLQRRATAETAPMGQLAEKSAHGTQQLWGRRARRRGLPGRSAKPGRLLSAAYK